MATAEECAAALETLASRLEGAPVEGRRRDDRSLSLTITDLDAEFRGRIAQGRLVDVVQSPNGAQLEAQAMGQSAPGRAQIRLRCTSDDLVALVVGELTAMSAWTGGKLRVDANPLDLLRLKTLF